MIEKLIFVGQTGANLSALDFGIEGAYFMEVGCLNALTTKMGDSLKSMEGS